MATASTARLESVAEVLLERYLERLRRSFPAELTAVVEFELLERGRCARRLQLELASGHCTLHRRPARAPTVRLSLVTADLVRLLEGEASPGELFLRQRLRVSGDVLLASRLPQLLGLPRGRPRLAA